VDYFLQLRRYNGSNEWQGDVRINDEHTNFGWFSRDKLPALELISPPIIPVIQKYLS
jgi:8-oxo-dGTP pyrophosphatase MutT (NUDIX family)